MGITIEEFRSIVDEVISDYSEIESVQVSGGFVNCMVRSRSGKSSWQFKLYFDESGEIDGTWSYWCGMPGTNLPTRVGYEISERIRDLI